MQVRACEGAAAACGPILSSTDREASARAGAQGIQPNLTEARGKWYERARELGAAEAESVGEVGWGLGATCHPGIRAPGSELGQAANMPGPRGVPRLYSAGLK